MGDRAKVRRWLNAEARCLATRSNFLDLYSNSKPQCQYFLGGRSEAGCASLGGGLLGMDLAADGATCLQGRRSLDVREQRQLLTATTEGIAGRWDGRPVEQPES